MSEIDLKDHIDKRFDNVDRDMQSVQASLKGLEGFRRGAEKDLIVLDMTTRNQQKSIDKLDAFKKDHEETHKKTTGALRWAIGISGGVGLILGGIGAAITLAIRASKVLGS